MHGEFCCVAAHLAHGLGTPRQRLPKPEGQRIYVQHEVLRLGSNLCNIHYRVRHRVARLESPFSHVKDWFRLFFLVTGEGSEFPAKEDIHHEFPIRIVWGVMSDDKKICWNKLSWRQVMLG